MTQRLKRHPFLALFDGADPNTSTASRLDTTVPTQALYFMNDPFVHRASQALANRIIESISPHQRLRRAFHAVHQRAPTEAEIQLAADFMANYQAALVDAKVPELQIETDSLAAWLRVTMAAMSLYTLINWTAPLASMAIWLDQVFVDRWNFN